MQKFKRDEIIYSVGTRTEYCAGGDRVLLEHGTVNITLSDDRFNDPHCDCKITSRRGDDICISDRGALRALHAALGDIIHDIDNDLIDMGQKWNKQ